MYSSGTPVQVGKTLLRINRTESQHFEINALAHDISFNYNFANRDTTNPFKPPSFDFNTTWAVAKKAVHTYGVWQNADCDRMRHAL